MMQTLRITNISHLINKRSNDEKIKSNYIVGDSIHCNGGQ